MDRLELLAKMREVGIKVPAMIVTAYSDVPPAVESDEAGSNRFLQKPLRPEIFADIAEILKSRAARRSPGRVSTAHRGGKTVLMMHPTLFHFT
jgi:FixJ family two-component response regulator